VAVDSAARPELVRSAEIDIPFNDDLSEDENEFVDVTNLLSRVRANTSTQATREKTPTPDGCYGCGLFKPQSGTVSALKMYSAPTAHKEHNVRFRDQMENYVVDIASGSDDIHTHRDTNDADLNAFFSRPLKVVEYEWGTGLTLFDFFNPWKLYFENVRVINRICNYKLLRARLHVKFVINGNGFHYGRVMASYLPLAALNDFTTSGLVAPDAVIESQRPHVFLDPTTSTGGELILPFFWPKSYIDIPQEEWNVMGEITLRSLNALRHANGADDKCTISIFVWAEDVQLSGLTANEPGALLPQSGTEVDQANMKGAISGPATAVSELAGKLASIPAISKYAKATQLGASSLASVAKAFGYSKPPMTVAPTPMRPTYGSSLATVTTPDTSHKLTMDDKQELCIDPTTTGLGSTDEMVIKEIASRESYLTTFAWDLGTPNEDMLWNAVVTPAQYRTFPGPPVNYFLPACCYAVMPFKYWSGSMKFRFQIVASTFHKGRLKIVYDPTSTGIAEYNTVYTEIVDIADTQDFTITVTNNQSRDILDYRTPCGNGENFVHGVNPILVPGQGNGTISVYVVNSLTTPNSTADANIEVNVFVSMGDDFEVYVPTDTISPFHFLPQSGAEVVPESQETEEPSAPFQTNFDHLGMSGDSANALTSVYIGESVKSFRQLAKRYVLWRSTPTASAATNGQYIANIRHPALPILRGYDLSGPDGGYNLFNTTFVNWVRMPYAGWRGSIRYKCVARTSPSGRHNTITAEVTDNPLNSYDYQSQTYVSITDPVLAARQVMQGVSNEVIGYTGAAMTTIQNASVLEYEVPYQVPFRFDPTRRRASSASSQYMRGARIRHLGISDGSNLLNFWVAGGEDFSTFFWIGPPRLVCEPDGPPSGS
jgi:hypothetical protein